MRIEDLFGSSKFGLDSGGPSPVVSLPAFDGEPDALRAFFELAPVAMLIVGDEGKILMSNAAWQLDALTSILVSLAQAASTSGHSP